MFGRLRFPLASCALVLGTLGGCDDGEGDDDVVRDGGVDGSLDAASEAGAGDGATRPSDAGGDAGPVQQVSIRFKAKVGSADLACGQSYASLGTTKVRGTPGDFRFFVQEVRLINSAGQEVPVTFEERGNHQAPGIALLDFNDGQGSCEGDGTSLNDVITGTVPVGTYQGIVFVNGVDPMLNHGTTPSTGPLPLRAPGAFWDWRQGYRFVMAELLVEEGGDAGAGVPMAMLDGGTHMDGGAHGSDAGHAASDAGHGGHGGHGGGGASFVHTGTIGCTGTAGSDGSGISCNNANYRPNRAQVRFAAFNPATQYIVADFGAIFASVDLAQGARCHGSGPACAPMYQALGIDPQTGAPLSTQSVFRVE